MVLEQMAIASRWEGARGTEMATAAAAAAATAAATGETLGASRMTHLLD